MALQVVVHLAGAQHEPGDVLLVLQRRARRRARPRTCRRSARSRLDAASLARSRLFGVITMSGRRSLASACSRSRWKNCAGVVGLTTVMLSSAPIFRNRSRRAEECSGPLPSKPCGSSSVSRDFSPHFDSDDDDELVDDHLRAVGEVAVLRLPDHERRGARDGVAVLEPEARVLGQRRVVDLEAGAGAGEVLERREQLARLDVVQHCVAVRERAALGVLARHPDVDAVAQQRREGQRLGGGPVDRAVVEHLARGAPAGSRASGAP